MNVFAITTAISIAFSAAVTHAQINSPTKAIIPNEQSLAANPTSDNTPANLLSPDQWRQVDAAVQRGLNWLAAQKRPNGSFPTQTTGQPAVTCLAMMAFIAHGNTPGHGRFGVRLERAADYVVSCQKPNGLVSLVGPDGEEISRSVTHEIGTCAAYNHAISSLTLSEVYGMCDRERARHIQTAINKSLIATLVMQRWPKDRAADRGGWRYIDDSGTNSEFDSDLSITGWELMFLRSARNGGFNVPEQPIDDAVAYVRRCYSQRYGVFQYVTSDDDDRSRAMAGAGILALAHAGFHGAPEAKKSADWILRHNFDAYNTILPLGSGRHDRYHYALFACCQAMYQLGGQYWQDFFPRTVATLLANQQPDGSWPADSHWHDGQFGRAYTTALVLMTLGAPNQLLPIYQR
ncbi:MAG TPA: prenyltransferase/squalene oxidase repeat-containing protein [Lacipirellulaceae bacterium]|nr:prenyltransferase/squalene oxidase repeat-containing protein [Lacipirellulaceae bacterium]